MVLELGLGQGGPVLDGPVDRFEIAIDEALFDQRGKDLQHRTLVGGEHGHVGVVVVAGGAEPHHLLGLDLLKTGGVVAAAVADLHGAEIGGLRTDLLHDLVLDGQPVAVPARDELDLVARHLPAAHHQVLEDLVDQMAHVDIAVGVGRPVVEDKGPGRMRLLLLPAIEIDGFPPLLEAGFFGQKPGAHAECGLRQVQGLAITVFLLLS